MATILLPMSLKRTTPEHEAMCNETSKNRDKSENGINERSK